MIRYYETENGKKELAGKTNNLTVSTSKHIVFNEEFKSLAKVGLIGVIVVALLMIVLVVIFPLLQDFFQSTLMEGNDAAQLFSIFGDNYSKMSTYFNAVSTFVWLLLGSAIISVIAIKAISGSIKDGTAEFYYSLPVNKNKFFSSKYFSVVLWTIIIDVVVAFVSYVASFAISKGDVVLTNFLMYSGLALLLHLIVATLCFGLGTFYKKKSSTGAGVGIVIVMAIVQLITLIIGQLSFLMYVTPFAMFNTNILETGVANVNWVVVGVWAGLGLITLISSSIYFNKKDIIC